MLGKYVQQQFSQKKGADIILTNRSEINIAKPEGICKKLNDYNPEIIIHLAAETDVDKCELDPSHAAMCNWISTKNIAAWAAKKNRYILYVSTSNIFNNISIPCANELNIPDPINYYGLSKLNGEKSVTLLCPDNSMVIRAGWMVGGGMKNDHKFVGKIIRKLNEVNEDISAVNDKYGTITIAEELAKFISMSTDKLTTGIYNYADKGLVSRYDIAVYIAELLNFKNKIKGVSSASYPLQAKRPFSDGINSIFLGEEHGIKTWKESIKKYVETF